MIAEAPNMTVFEQQSRRTVPVLETGRQTNVL